MSDGFLSPTPPETLPAAETSSQEEPSAVALDEQALEQLEEQAQAEEFLETPEEVTADIEGHLPEPSTQSVEAAVEGPVDEVIVEIEKILEDGLKVYYQGFAEDVQQKFRCKGREVAAELALWVKKKSAKPADVLKLVRNWLLTIPGVNKYFLEQVAKIKTDLVIALENQQRQKQNPNQIT